MAQAQLNQRKTRLIPSSKRSRTPKNEKTFQSKLDLVQIQPYSPSSDVPPFDHEGRKVKRYSCDACGDCFLFKASLNQHINRRSVKLTCILNESGTKKLNFYNKCAQYYYFKGQISQKVVGEEILFPLLSDEKATFIDNISPHIEKEEITIDPSSSKGPKVIIKIKREIDTPSGVPLEPSTNSTTTISTPTNTNTNTNTNTKTNTTTTNVSNNTINKSKNISNTNTKTKANSEPKEKKEVKCLECDTIFPNISSRKEHFNSITDDGGPVQCSTCALWCPNRCSLKAHKRLHSMGTPHVCPECGFHSEKTFKKIISHSIIKCQHLLRQLLYICSQCKITFNTINSLIEHITSNHTKQLIRCCTCNQNFDSIDGFERHKVSHPSEDGYRNDNFYQCHICSKELLSKILCFTHIESHLRKMNDTIKFVYTCPQCKERQCDSGSQVIVHLQAAHLLDLTKPDREASLIESLCDRHKIKLSKDNKESTDKGTTNSNSTSFTKSSTSSSSSTLTSNQPLSDQILNAAKFACEICGLITNSWDDMADHGITKHIEEEALFVCLICSNKKFTRRNSLLAHLRKFHTTSLACPSQRCISLRFSNANDVYTHYRIKHRLQDNQGGESKESGKSVQPRNNSDATSAKRPKTTNKKQKNLNTNLSTLMNNTSMDSLNSASFFEENGSSDILRDSLLNGSDHLYNCIHCGFQADGIKQLQAHYSIHRTPKSPYLCYECGTSFTSYSLLDRHLTNQHGITDCQNYVKINLPDLYQEKVDPNNVDLLGIIQNDTLNVSICPICSKICPDSASLKSHVKVHGMAFINSIRKSLNTSTTNDVA